MEDTIHPSVEEETHPVNTHMDPLLLSLPTMGMINHPLPLLPLAMVTTTPLLSRLLVPLSPKCIIMQLSQPIVLPSIPIPLPLPMDMTSLLLPLLLAMTLLPTNPLQSPQPLPVLLLPMAMMSIPLPSHLLPLLLLKYTSSMAVLVPLYLVTRRRLPLLLLPPLDTRNPIHTYLTRMCL